jgi:hypothetical protein
MRILAPKMGKANKKRIQLRGQVTPADHKGPPWHRPTPEKPSTYLLGKSGVCHAIPFAPPELLIRT